MEIDFVFIDQQSRPFRVKTLGADYSSWLFYWHPDQKWVSVRKLSREEIDFYERYKLPQEQAALYDLAANQQLHPINDG